MSNDSSITIIYQLQTKNGIIYENYGGEAVISLEHNLLNNNLFSLIPGLIRSKEPDILGGVVNDRSIILCQLQEGKEFLFNARSKISDIDSADNSPPLLVRFEKVIAATPGESI